jgi:hypothetical protein
VGWGSSALFFAFVFLGGHVVGGGPPGPRPGVAPPQRRSDRLADLGVACDRSMAIKGARGRIPAPQGRVRTQGSRPAAPPLSDSHGPLRVPTLGRCPAPALPPMNGWSKRCRGPSVQANAAREQDQACDHSPENVGGPAKES